MQITRGLPEHKDQVDATNQRWDKLNADLDERENDLDDALKHLGVIEEKLKPIEAVVEEAQKLVKDPVLIGADIEKGKEAKKNTKVCYDRFNSGRTEDCFVYITLLTIINNYFS